MTDVEGLSFLPQAIIGGSVEDLSRRLRVEFTSGHDEFDDYLGAAFVLKEAIPFALKQYRGHARDTVTLYLPHDIRDVPRVTSMISDILFELDLPNDLLIWQRSDDPDL